MILLTKSWMCGIQCELVFVGPTPVILPTRYCTKLRTFSEKNTFIHCAVICCSKTPSNTLHDWKKKHWWNERLEILLSKWDRSWRFSVWLQSVFSLLLPPENTRQSDMARNSTRVALINITFPNGLSKTSCKCNKTTENCCKGTDRCSCCKGTDKRERITRRTFNHTTTFST